MMTFSKVINSRSGQTLLALLLAIGITALFLHSELFILIPIAIGLIPIFIYIIILRSYWICILFIAFSFFRLHEVFPMLYPLKIPQLLALSMFFLLSIDLIFKRISPYWTKEMAYFCVFFLLVTIGMVLSSNFDASFKSWSGTFIKIFLTFFALCWLVNSPRSYKAMIRTIILCGLLVSFVTLYNKFNNIGLVEGTRVTIGRDIGSLLGDPNDLALVLLFPFSFAMSIYSTSHQRFWRKFAGLITCSILVSAIIATQSRGGLLGVITVISFFMYSKAKSKVLVIFTSLFGIIILSFLAGLSERSSGGSHEEGIDESAMGRLYAWKAAIKMAFDNPLFGVGISGFYYNYYFYIDKWTGKNYVVHSTWFGVLAETGFLGLIIFAMCIYHAFRTTSHSITLLEKNTYDNQLALATLAYALKAGLIGFCISGTFLTQGFLWPFYILYSLSISLNYYVINNRCPIE